MTLHGLWFELNSLLGSEDLSRFLDFRFLLRGSEEEQAKEESCCLKLRASESCGTGAAGPDIK